MFKVAIVGRSNVGKSTLFNTLIGERKAIVEKTPGITRDMIEGYMELEDSKGIILLDTGGINWGGKDFFNRTIMEVVDKSLNESDLVLLVVDGKEGLTREDLTNAEYLRKKDKKVILVVNKVENKEDRERAFDFYSLGFGDVVFISAKQKANIDKLKELIKKYAKDYLEELPQPPDVKIAIIGRPNVGKSTLLNKLLGYERMIISEIPGTTRDCVDVFLEFPDGKKYLLIDTPGIRRRTRIDERAEKFSVDKALETVKKVDLVLLIITAEEGITNQDQRLLRQIQKNCKVCILLVNKWDLFDKKREAGNLMLEKIRYGIRFVPWVPILTISAKTGKNVNQIFPLVEEVYRQYNLRVKTVLVNKVLEEIKRNYSFNVSNKKVKFYYATQVTVKPPTFVIFTNIDPESIPKHIEKFMENSFKKYLEFDKVPVKIIFRLKR